MQCIAVFFNLQNIINGRHRFSSNNQRLDSINISLYISHGFDNGRMLNTFKVKLKVLFHNRYIFFTST